MLIARLVLGLVAFISSIASAVIGLTVGLVRMAIQNFSKNPVISTVSGLAG